MNLNLDKDICFLDLEATGLHVLRDRILQIAIIKYYADGRPAEEKCLLINPGIPISQDAINVHGITPDMVRNKPTFPQVADELFHFIGDADIAGYNSNRFDIPFLMEEFARAGLDFDISKRRMIDVQRIFYLMEPRTLKAAVKFYCGSDFTDAHDALADVRATVDVLNGQLKKYDGISIEGEDGTMIPSPVISNVQALHDLTNDLKMLDATQRLRYNDEGQIVFNFGKYTGQTVESVFRDEPAYYNWMLGKDFSVQVKKIIKKIYEQVRAGNN